MLQMKDVKRTSYQRSDENKTIRWFSSPLLFHVLHCPFTIFFFQTKEKFFLKPPPLVEGIAFTDMNLSRPLLKVCSCVNFLVGVFLMPHFQISVVLLLLR